MISKLKRLNKKQLAVILVILLIGLGIFMWLQRVEEQPTSTPAQQGQGANPSESNLDVTRSIIDEDYDQAVRILSKRLDEAGNDEEKYEIYYSLASVYRQAERYDDAIKAAQSAVKLNKNEVSLVMLAGSHELAGNRDQALESYRDAYEIMQSSPITDPAEEEPIIEAIRRLGG
jgi:tetratricopeptide (TPR) repeat protein